MEKSIYQAIQEGTHLEEFHANLSAYLLTGCGSDILQSSFYILYNIPSLILGSYIFMFILIVINRSQNWLIRNVSTPNINRFLNGTLFYFILEHIIQTEVRNVYYCVSISL